MIVFVVLVFTFCLCLGLVLFGRRNYGTLEACGIPVDNKSSFFLGIDFNFHNNVRHLQDLRRYQQYGPVWGAYIGGTPQVFIADPELIRKVLVSDSDHFCDRRSIDLGSPVLEELIGYTKGDKWRHLRSMMGPLFTPAKIKTASRVMSQCANELVQGLKSDCKQERIKIDCRDTLIPYFIDMIFRAALGVQMGSKDNDFVKAFKQFMGEETEYNLLYTLSLTFPFLTRFAPTHDHIYIHTIEKTIREVLSSLSSATQANGGAIDHKQISSVIIDYWNKANSKEFLKLGISDNTIVSQILDFFIGGYEAPAATLSHLLLYIAQNAEVEKTLQKEIDRAVENNDGMIDHETIKESAIPYATACIKEALRLCPAIFGPQRICNKDWVHDSLTIKKGTPVMVATWAANRNPEVFPDPEKFIPERFLPENKGNIHPYAFTTFGHGPRKCVGTKFSYESMAMFLVHVIRNFNIELRKDTELRYKTGSLMLVNFDSLYLDLVCRN